MTQEQEALVIAAVLDGQTDRFEELVRANERGIYALCLRMLGSEQDALDASQEAFFRAYRALSSFRGESRFSVWLYKTAANVCRDALRRRPAEPPMPLEDDEGAELPIPDGRFDPQTELERAELRRAVHEGLNALSPEYREVLVLREINGLSYDEIAHVAGIEAGTVKSRLYRARRSLAAILLRGGNISGGEPSNPSNAQIGKGGEPREHAM